MSEALLSQKMQKVYFVAASRLAIINAYPRVVKMGAIGFYMTVDCIRESIGSFDPTDWYKDQKYEREELSFSSLPQEDQGKVITVITDIIESISESDLISNCRKCGAVVYEFDDKIMERKK